MSDSPPAPLPPRSPALPWPPQDDDIRQTLLAAWQDGSWGRYHGPQHQRLVGALQELLHVEHVYPCCSGTFAVELALRMLKVGPGDEVIVAGYDFAGNFRAIESAGASPVLIDIVPRRWHLDPAQLESAASPRVKAIIVSHLHGVLAPMREIMEIARRRGWLVVEDACQASGAAIDGRAAGTWGDVGALSFGGSKLLTAGRGGAVVTGDATLLQRAKVYCEQGNHAYPLSELQAAVLLPQIARLAERNELRRAAVRRILSAYQPLAADQGDCRLSIGDAADADDLPAYYKLGWLVEMAGDGPEFPRTQQLRDALAAALQAAGIDIDAGFRGFGKRSSTRCRKVGELTQANHAAAGTLVLHHPVLLAEATVHDHVGRTMAEAASSANVAGFRCV